MDTTMIESWYKLSLPEQMINIGNEVKRAVRFDKDIEKKKSFIDNALKYIDMTIDDPKNHTVIPELRLGKDTLEDYIGNRDMNCTKEQIRDYYMQFVYLLKA